MAYRPKISRHRNSHVPAQFIEVQNELNKMKDQMKDLQFNSNYNNQNNQNNQNEQREEKWNNLFQEQQEIIKQQTAQMNVINAQLQQIMNKQQTVSTSHSNINENIRVRNRQSHFVDMNNRQSASHLSIPQNTNDIIHLLGLSGNNNDCILNNGFAKNYINNINYTPANNNNNNNNRMPLTPQRRISKQRQQGVYKWDEVICEYDTKVICVSDHGKYAKGRRKSVHFYNYHPNHHTSMIVNYKGGNYECFRNHDFFNMDLENAINSSEH